MSVWTNWIIHIDNTLLSTHNSYRIKFIIVYYTFLASHKVVSTNVNNNTVVLPAVIGKLDNVVRVTKLLSVRHHLEERTINVFSVHHQAALEEPMAAVLAE